MKKAQIEPGMLSLFRLATVLWLVLAGAAMIGSVFGWNSFTARELIGMINAALLLWYLYSDGAQRRLRRWYMPVALGIVFLGPLMVQWFTVAWRIMHDMPLEELTEDDIGLFGVLFFPAIIVTVQYSYRTMLGFTLFTAVLQVLMMLTLIPVDSPTMEFVWGDVGARAVIYPIIGFFVVRLVSGQKKDRHALAAKNVQLTQYATTVERLAISHERNRLARELHDTLAHTLSAVAVQVEALNKQLGHDPDSAKHTIQQLRDLTRSGLQESRRALQALRASPLEDLGLTLALRQLVDATAERSGLAISLDIADDLDDLRPEVEQSIYRITEEALNNTVRHANAQTATISLHRERGDLRLTITDDGFGFNPETVTQNGHYGLVGMRERALLCNGQLDIHSTPATGTTVRLTVEV